MSLNEGNISGVTFFNTEIFIVTLIISHQVKIYYKKCWTKMLLWGKAKQGRISRYRKENKRVFSTLLQNIDLVFSALDL